MSSNTNYSFEIVNNKLNLWTDNYGYQLLTGSELKQAVVTSPVEQSVRSGVTETFPGEYDIEDINSLDDDEQVLVKSTSETKEFKAPRQRNLEERLGNLRRQLSQAERRLKALQSSDGPLKDTRDDLEALKEDEEQLESRLNDITEDMQDATGLDTRNPATLLGAVSKQPGNNLASQWGSVSRQLSGVRSDIDSVKQEIQDLKDEREQLQDRIPQLQERIENTKDQIERVDTDEFGITIIQDIILICRLRFQLYIQGDYRKNGNLRSRIGGQGTKIIIIGAKAPIQIRGTQKESQWWANLYDDIEEDLAGTNFNGNAYNGNDVTDGEAFDALIDSMQDQQQSGAPRSQVSRSNFINQASYQGRWDWSINIHYSQKQMQQRQDSDKTCETWEERTY